MPSPPSAQGVPLPQPVSHPSGDRGTPGSSSCPFVLPSITVLGTENAAVGSDPFPSPSRGTQSLFAEGNQGWGGLCAGGAALGSWWERCCCATAPSALGWLSPGALGHGCWDGGAQPSLGNVPSATGSCNFHSSSQHPSLAEISRREYPRLP